MTLVTPSDHLLPQHDFCAMFHDWPLRCVYLCFKEPSHLGSATDVIRMIASKRHANFRYVYCVAGDETLWTTYHCYRLLPPGSNLPDGNNTDNELPDGVTEIGRFEAEAIHQAFLDANADNAHLVGEDINA